MKKKIVIGVFLLLILITMILTIVGAIESYRYDMDPANGVDIMEGMGAGFLIIIGGFVVFYELDLLCTVCFFFVKEKTVAKAIPNFLSNLCLLLVLFTDPIAKALSVGEEVIVMIVLLLLYVVFRFVYCVALFGDSFRALL